MSSTKPAQEATPHPSQDPSRSGAGAPAAADSGGAAATEEDIGTEGAGTEPETDPDLEVVKSPAGKRDDRGNPA